MLRAGLIDSRKPAVAQHAPQRRLPRRKPVRWFREAIGATPSQLVAFRRHVNMIAFYPGTFDPIVMATIRRMQPIVPAEPNPFRGLSLLVCENVPGMADYCVYWFRKAQGHLRECTADDPVAGRAGLVGTQNIRNNQSRVGGLDYIVETGTIVEAVDNQPWSGEADVHVSIANWANTKNPALVPPLKRLWFNVNQSGTGKIEGKKGFARIKSFDLAYRETRFINSALSDDIDVSRKKPLAINGSPKRCFQGKIPGYAGFVLDADEAQQISQDSAAVVVPYLIGRELLADFKIVRWAIDFGNRGMQEAATFKSAFAHCKLAVLPEVQRRYEDARNAGTDMAKAREEHLGRWWQFWNRRDGLSETLRSLPRYVGCSRVTRRPVMVFLSSAICPSDLVQVFAFDDDYSFGILQSLAHFEWYRKSSRLKVESDLRYSVRAVFETFPWPQSPQTSDVGAVANAGREIRRIRAESMRMRAGGLRALYRLLELPGKHPLKDAHAELDRAVVRAYGFSPTSDILSQTLELNAQVARAEAEHRQVTGPGVPASGGSEGQLLTDDCLSV